MAPAQGASTTVSAVVDETQAFLQGFIGHVAQAPLHLVDNEYI